MKASHVARWIALAIGAVLLAFVGVLATRADYEAKLVGTPLLGQPAPALAGTSIDGQGVDVASLRGKWVVVNFFASWCIPCQREHPEFVRFVERHRTRDDAELVMVIHGDEVGPVRSYLAANGGEWPVVDDPDGRVALEFGVRGQPESYVIDPDGIVRAKAFEITADLLEQIISGEPVS
jgi:cytochrome c biogenesis protein CcmG, thiol:disulfide interchange protein DsbE